MYSCGPLHTDEQELGNSLEPIYNSSVVIQDVAGKTFPEQWTTEKNGERESRKSIQAACHDDDDDVYVYTYNKSVCAYVCTHTHTHTHSYTHIYWVSAYNWTHNL